MTDREWDALSDTEQIAYIRKVYGRAPVKHKKSPCKKCEIMFTAQFVGSTRTEWYCRKCIATLHQVPIGLDG